jgi:hypothetical protein
MAAHRYWRLRINSTAFVDWAAIADISGIETISGPNVLIGGTAAASGFFPGFPPANAFDAFPGSSWVVNQAPIAGVWISYDLGLGVAKDIKQITLTSRDAQGTQGPTDADWQWSDDNLAWTTYFNFVTPAWGNTETRTFGILPDVPQIAQVVIQGVEIVAAPPIQIAQMVMIAVLSGPPNSYSLGNAFKLPCWQPCTAFGTEAIVIKLR